MAIDPHESLPCEMNQPCSVPFIASRLVVTFEASTELTSRTRFMQIMDLSVKPLKGGRNLGFDPL